ncbi:unnamed protein product [Ilex paraguariensis]|uniref:Uncharacterized protein n=1 Tax=Ilex paraguariensis TaxID=185542 RepID=A0ABC8UU26_9AQUA
MVLMSLGQCRESGISAADKDTSKHVIETEEEVPIFLYRNNCVPSLVVTSRRDSDAEKKDSCSAPVLLPVCGGPSILPRAQSFHFQEKRKLKRNMLNWKLVQSNDIISLIRRGKRI